MSQPVSRPNIPDQPSTVAYSPSELALFRTYTRETYRSTFGADAPTFDPSRPVKAWFDSTVDLSDPSNVAIYKVLGRDSSGALALRQLIMPATEAASVNLQGAITYPPYAPAPTAATRGGSILNPNYLCTEAEAREILQQIGGDSLIEDSHLAVFPTIYPSDEPRRWWTISWRGKELNAGLLLCNRNSKGIGAPGHWDLSGLEPQWIATITPTGDGDTRPPREMPLRALLPNEKLQAGPMGIAQVVRLDLQAAQAQASGAFTQDDRAMLQKILQLLSARVSS